MSLSESRLSKGKKDKQQSLRALIEDEGLSQ